MTNLRFLLSFLLALALCSATSAQIVCYTGSCVSSPFALMQSPVTLSLSSPFGAAHNAFTVRPQGGPDAVAAVCARSFGLVPPFPFPLEPTAGNVLVDVGSSLIDLNPMTDLQAGSGGPLGVFFGTIPLPVPNDPTLVGLEIHSQAFLLLNTGSWAVANCSVTGLIP